MPRRPAIVQMTGVDELGRTLKAIGDEREILRVAAHAFRKTGRHIRSEMVDEGRKRGILRTLFAGNRKRRVGLNRAVKMHRVRRKGDDIQAKLNTVGGAGAMVTIQETGGRFRPHVIRPKLAPKLVFYSHGRLVVTDRVQHPGARHPRMPLFWPTVRDSAPRLRRAVAEALQNYFRGKAVA